MNVGWLKKHATTLVLSALAIGAATWVVADRGSITTSEAEKRKRNLLPAWRLDDVTEVTVELPGDKYTLTRAKDGEQRPWSLTIDDVKMPAEDQSVDKLLGSFEYAQFVREVPASSVDRAAFGIDAPTARFQIHMGELAYDVKVGAATAGSPDERYVEVVGRGVYVVSASLVAALSRPADDVRARDVVPYLSTDLAALTLVGKGGDRRFERAPWSGGRGSGFRFAQGGEGPVGKRVDGSRLDQVFVAFGRMQAETFVEAAAAEAAGRNDVTVTLVPKHGAEGILVVGGDCPGKEGLTLVRKTAPTPLAVCVPTGILAPLYWPVADFVDDGLIGATVDEIVEVDITLGDKTFDLVRNERGFKLRAPEQRDLSLDAGNRFLKSLVSVRGVPVDEAPTFAGEVTKVKVLSQGGVSPTGGMADRTEDIDLGSTDGEHRIALRREDGAALTIGVDAALAFESAHLLLLDRRVLAFNPLGVESLTLERADLVQELTRQGSDYAFVAPKNAGLEVDQAWTTEAIDALSSLTAERFVAEAADPSFGLDPPRAKIVIHVGATSKAAPTTITLRLGNATDDGPYAQVEGKPAVFIAPESIATLAGRLLVSRASFSIRPADLDKLVVEAEQGKRVTLVRDGSRLVVEGHPADAAAGEVAGALDELVALEAVGVGSPKPEQGLESPALKVTVTGRRTSTDATPPKPVVLQIGASDTLRGESIRYARRSDIDATFAVPAGAVRRLLSTAGVE